MQTDQSKAISPLSGPDTQTIFLFLNHLKARCQKPGEYHYSPKPMEIIQTSQLKTLYIALPCLFNQKLNKGYSLNLSLVPAFAS